MQTMQPLFEKIFFAPATSSPAERIFSHSGLLMRPNRVLMNDRLLSHAKNCENRPLVILRCNNAMQLDVLYC